MLQEGLLDTEEEQSELARNTLSIATGTGQAKKRFRKWFEYLNYFVQGSKKSKRNRDEQSLGPIDSQEADAEEEEGNKKNQQEVGTAGKPTKKPKRGTKKAKARASTRKSKISEKEEAQKKQKVDLPAEEEEEEEISPAKARFVFDALDEQTHAGTDEVEPEEITESAAIAGNHSSVVFSCRGVTDSKYSLSKELVARSSSIGVATVKKAMSIRKHPFAPEFAGVLAQHSIRHDGLPVPVALLVATLSLLGLICPVGFTAKKGDDWQFAQRDAADFCRAAGLESLADLQKVCVAMMLACFLGMSQGEPFNGKHYRYLVSELQLPINSVTKPTNAEVGLMSSILSKVPQSHLYITIAPALKSAGSVPKAFLPLETLYSAKSTFCAPPDLGVVSLSLTARLSDVIVRGPAPRSLATLKAFATELRSLLPLCKCLHSQSSCVLSSLRLTLSFRSFTSSTISLRLFYFRISERSLSHG